jgi:hypothetical protein
MRDEGGGIKGTPLKTFPHLEPAEKLVQIAINNENGVADSQRRFSWG